GSVSPSIAAVATAASAALPPCLRICRPAWAASGWLVATMPWRASTSERVCWVQNHIRSPRTAVMLADGLGIFLVGMPNGVGETLPDAANEPEATPTAINAAAITHRPDHLVVP